MKSGGAGLIVSVGLVGAIAYIVSKGTAAEATVDPKPVTPGTPPGPSPSGAPPLNPADVPAGIAIEQWANYGWWYAEPAKHVPFFPPTAVTRPLLYGERVVLYMVNNEDPNQATAAVAVTGVITDHNATKTRYQIQVEQATYVKGAPEYVKDPAPKAGQTFFAYRNRFVSSP